MTKRLKTLPLLLALLLALPLGALAEESLVSRAYLEGAYLAALSRQIETLILRERAEPVTVGEAAELAEVSAGGVVSLVEGQSAVLLQGSAVLSITRGSVVNAAVGYEAVSDSMNPRQRYIVCEGSALEIRVTADALLSLSGGAAIVQGESAPTPTPVSVLTVSPFTDVQPGQWFHDDVLAAVSRGLVNGMTPTTYEPQGTLTLSQCVKLAACMHQLWHEGAVTLENAADGPWYQSYVDYAVANGIISGFRSDGVVSRAQFVSVFYRALPESAYAMINVIPDGAIPDVPVGDSVAAEVYAFYRAGILTGYADGSFRPESTITRAEVAAIMNRMFDENARVSFSIG